MSAPSSALPRLRAAVLPAWSLARTSLAAVLFAAAALKTWDLARGAPTPERLFLPRSLVVLVVLLELGFAIWLLVNVVPRWNRIAAIILFSGFFELNLWLALSGYHTCPCLGRIEIHPWFMTTIDGLIVLALVAVSPGTAPRGIQKRFGVFLALFGVVSGPAFALMATPYPQGVVPDLRKDSRLREKVVLDLSNPDNTQVLEILREKTGLTLTLDPSVEEGNPKLGRVKSTFPAWSLMEFLAQNQAHAARWDKNADGYHLTTSASPSSRWTTWLIGIGAFCVTATGLFIIYRSLRVKRAATNESHAEQTLVASNSESMP